MYRLSNENSLMKFYWHLGLKNMSLFFDNLLIVHLVHSHLFSRFKAIFIPLFKVFTLKFHLYFTGILSYAHCLPMRMQIIITTFSSTQYLIFYFILLFISNSLPHDNICRQKNSFLNKFIFIKFGHKLVVGIFILTWHEYSIIGNIQLSIRQLWLMIQTGKKIR